MCYRAVWPVLGCGRLQENGTEPNHRRDLRKEFMKMMAPEGREDGQHRCRGVGGTGSQLWSEQATRMRGAARGR